MVRLSVVIIVLIVLGFILVSLGGFNLLPPGPSDPPAGPFAFRLFFVTASDWNCMGSFDDLNITLDSVFFPFRFEDYGISSPDVIFITDSQFRGELDESHVVRLEVDSIPIDVTDAFFHTGNNQAVAIDVGTAC